MTRIPPQSIDSERALISSMLQDKTACDIAFTTAKEDFFYHPTHQILFRAMDGLYKANKPIDQLTVVVELQRLKLIEDVGGAGHVSEIANRVPSGGNAKYYLDIVQEAYKRRQLISNSTEIIDKAYDGVNDINEVIDEYQSKLSESRDNGIESSNMMDLMLSIEDERPQAIRTGFTGFDMRFDGLRRKELSIVAGRASMGKTSWAMTTMLNMAKRGLNVVFFSQEMSRESVATRFASMESGIYHHLIKSNFVPPNQIELLTDTARYLSEIPIETIEKPNLSIYEIKALARQFYSQGKCDIVFIDYVQIMKLLGKNLTTSEKLGMISREAKNLAKELDIHVCLLSQLKRREPTSRDIEPHMSDLRSSGELEQDADMVIFPFRPHMINQEFNEDIAKLIMAKNRNGQTGYYDLMWDGNTVKYYERERKFDVTKTNV